MSKNVFKNDAPFGTIHLYSKQRNVCWFYLNLQVYLCMQKKAHIASKLIIFRDAEACRAAERWIVARKQRIHHFASINSHFRFVVDVTDFPVESYVGIVVLGDDNTAHLCMRSSSYTDFLFVFSLCQWFMWIVEFKYNFNGKICTNTYA